MVNSREQRGRPRRNGSQRSPGCVPKGREGPLAIMETVVKKAYFRKMMSLVLR